MSRYVFEEEPSRYVFESAPSPLDNPNMATEGMSGLDKFKAGAGKAITDLVRGAGQLMGIGPSGEQTAATNRLDAPLMATGAGLAGNVAGNIAATLPTLAIPGINSYTGALGLGGVLGAMQPAENTSQRVMSTGLGAAGGLAGQAIGNVVSGLIQPVKSGLSPEAVRLAGVAKSEGIPLDAAAATGSKPLQTINSVFENLPFTAEKQAEQIAARQAAFNQSVLKRAGIDATTATSDVLGAQKSALGKAFEDIASRNTLNFNNGLAYDLAKIGDTAERRLTKDAGAAFQNTVADILSEAPKGVMDGAKYQAWRTELNRLANGTDTTAHFYGQVKKSLDGAFNSQISGADAMAWKKASSEYANLKTILNAMGGSGKAAINGDISPAQLSMALGQSIGKEGKALGRGQLNDLSKVGNLFVRDTVPNSGTAQRQFYQSLLTLGGGTGTGAIGALATGHDPIQGAMYGAGIGAAGLAAPRAAQILLQNPALQWYMMRQANSPIAGILSDAIQNAGRTAGATAGALAGR